MDVFIPIFIFFTIFVLCSLCGFCCKKQEEGAIFSTPVVITSQTHQPVGTSTAYAVHSGPGVVQTSYQTVVVPNTMPMPYTDNTAPYPPSQPYAGAGMPYPQPYNYTSHSAPYPPQSTGPYPTQSPPQPFQQTMDPPAYNEVVANQSYQKQAPYNPHFNG